MNIGIDAVAILTLFSISLGMVVMGLDVLIERVLERRKDG